MKIIYEIRKEISNKKYNSAWARGVKEYALDLVDELIENASWNGLQESGYEFYGSPADEKALLNGADSWHKYSWGGCSFVYNDQIAERLCSPSELKKTDNGRKKPNAREEWLDVQARALYQASNLIWKLRNSQQI